MIDLTPHDKKVLAHIGRNGYGTEFVQILTKLRNQVSSLEGLEAGVDNNAGVEGRLLFKALADELIHHMRPDTRTRHVVDPDQFT